MPAINPKSFRNASLFASLSDDDLQVLARDAQIEHHAAGALIFKQNDQGGALYIVEHGTVELFVNDRMSSIVSLLTAGVGQVFGEMSILEDQPRSASARAVTDVELIVLYRDALIKVINERPQVALQMLRMLSSRLRTTSVLVQERVVVNANEAIANKHALGDKISDFFINKAGNVVFVLISLVWFVVWIGLNLRLFPNVDPFDPFPFGLLTMIVSLEMVFLSLFILIKQSRQAADDKVRNDVEYEVNVRSEMGIRSLTQHVDLLEQRILQRLDRLEGRENGFKRLEQVELDPFQHEDNTLADSL